MLHKACCFFLLSIILTACGKKGPLDPPPSEEPVKYPGIYPKEGGDENDFSAQGS